MPTDRPDLSIVIVSYNTREMTLACLHSTLSGSEGVTREVFLVDNDSRDGTVEAIREQFSDAIELIPNSDNRGFAAANNQALRKSSGRYALLLNPDTRLEPDALGELVSYLDAHSEVGAAGARLIHEDGKPQRSANRFPTLRSVLHRNTAWRYTRLFSRHYRDNRMKRVVFDEPTPIEVPVGAAFAVRDSVLEKVGLLDERFWMYYEEVDLALRIHQAGFEIHHLPQVVIVHHGGAASEGSQERVHVERLRSLVAYIRKHGGFPVRWFFLPWVFKVGFLVRLGIELPSSLFSILLERLRGRSDRSRSQALRLGDRLRFVRKHLIGFLFRF